MRIRRLLGLVALTLIAALADGQQGAVGDPAVASITGVVVDPQDALIPGATIHVGGDRVPDRSASTDGVGAFAINDLPSGTALRLTVRAEGFGEWHSEEVVLTPGEMLDLKSIKLVVAVAVSAVAAATPEKVAVEQVELAERQRVFGIFPNFYVAYDSRFVPLSPKLKFRLAVRTSTDAATFAGAGFLAGIDQASDVAPHYEQGASGYAKRFGASYTGTVTSVVLGGAVFPVLLHQDPRYFYRGTGSKKSRVLHAVLSPFIARGDNGRHQANISSMAGDISSSAMTNLYYPKIDRGVGLVFRGTLEITGARMVTALLQEFVLGRLTTNSGRARDR